MLSSSSVNVVVSCPEKTLEGEDVMGFVEQLALKSRVVIGYDWCGRKEWEKINWSDEKSVENSRWFVFYVGQVCGVLMVLFQCFKGVIMWQIKGGPICDVEQKNMYKIVNETVKDLKSKGFKDLWDRIEIRTVTFEKFKDYFLED